MLSLIILFIISFFSLILYYRYTRQIESLAIKELDKTKTEFNENKEEFNRLIGEISKSEEKIHNILKLYEINRKLSHIMNTSELLRVLPEELSRIEQVNNTSLAETPINPGLNKTKADNLHFTIKSKNKEWHLYLDCSEPLLQSQLPYLVSQFKLLLDRAQMYQELQRISITDSLTLLPNKKHFLERLTEEFYRSNKFNLSLTFLMMDIDHFKNYNDRYGHLVGDEILRLISQIIKDNIREIDLAGRFGGEEFSVFFPETAKEQALPVAERLRKEIEKYQFSVYDEKINLTVSIGLASSPQDAKNLEKMVEKADQALYTAKRSGRNCVCSASS
jgi:diguanylate cyclase (GGDEF)-like protein